MSEETIEHWTWIVRAVFQAESNIIDKWRDTLEQAKGTEDAEAVCEQYVRAVAKELLEKAYDYEPDKQE